LSLTAFRPTSWRWGLSCFETEVAAAIERTVEHKRCDAGDRALILNLIGLMALRNARQRKNM
jgi:hypothetical protein